MRQSQTIFERHKSRLRRLPLLAACALGLLLPVNAMAQESGLRGTVKDVPVETLSTLKKKKKPSKLETSTLIPDVIVLPRYEPTNLDPNDDKSEPEVPIATLAIPLKKQNPVGTKAVSQNSIVDPAAPKVDDVQTGGFPKKDAAKTGVTAAQDSEIPDPAKRITSDGASEREANGRLIKDNIRVGSIEGLGKDKDKETYDAPGIAAGEFTLRPTLKQGLTWTSNADSSATSKGAIFSETELKIRAQSNWSRHKLNFEATGALRKTLSGQVKSDPTFGLQVDFGLDVSTAVQVTGLASWSHAKESALAPAGFTSPYTRPDLDTLRATLGVAYDPGLIGVTATAQVTRQTYGNAKDSAGITVPQGDRNNTFASLTLRGSYDMSPSLTPFVEAEVGRRFYDHTVDTAGTKHSANRYGIRAGVAANLGEKLSGEIAAGWLMENIDDATLKDVSGVDLKGTLNWSPMRGTNVAFTLGTVVEGATSVSSSGSILYSSGASVIRTVRPNLELNFGAGADWRDYAGTGSSETILSAEAGATYFFNRYAGLNARLRHERILTSDLTRKRSTSSVYVGVTLRR